MADAPSAGDEPQAPVTHLTFNVKSSSDSKHVVTVPETMTVLELKAKLSTSEFADIPPERQRLIYSGRVLKDADPLSTYKIKDGNTVHMVKGAASNQRQNPASQSSSSATVQSNPSAAGVPQNIAAGTGNDPLAGLTGARYAGFAQMPGANQFGPDGGMGPPQSPDEMLRMLENPMFQSQMNEAMNNPHVIQMMQNMPMMRDQPWMRQMLENPEMRRMLMDPQVIRQSIQMSRMMGGLGGQGGQPSMPAPGVTDTTPQQGIGGSDAATDRAAGGQNAANPSDPASQPPNPFAMFGQPGAGAQGNPFAALFGGANPAFNPSGSFDPSNTANTSSTSQTGAQSPLQDQQQAPGNPFGSMFGNPGGANQQQNPMAAMTQQMMQNPELMRQAMQGMGMGGGLGNQAGGFNPFAGFGGAQPQQQPPQPPQDTRPPEEQYADQLRQLNEMGFFEFERNVRALRMSGGSVQGAVEVLLSGTI